MSSRSLSSACAAAGAGLLGLSLLKALSLTGASPLPRLGAALGLLLPAALALLLLRWEGYSRQSLLPMLLPIGLALFLRLLLLDHVTLDYQDFLSRWVEHFRQNGGFAALKDPVGNYNVPYLYFLALLSYLPFPDLHGIKLLSVFFDVILAWGGLRLVRQVSRKPAAPLSAFSALLLLPTVVLNGACWGQCDSLWAAFCLHALACALEDRPIPSLTLLALAFSFKLQAIFIIPLWCALWFLGRIKLRHLPVFPGVFALTMVPALLAGKPVGDILRVYLDQAGDSVSWQHLNYNSPSLFALLPYDAQPSPWMPKAAIALAFLFMLGILALLFLRRRAADNTALVLAGAALSLGIPFFLPYMHERYFFLGVVLLAVLCCALPECIPAAAGAELASLGGYHAYLLTRYAMAVTLFGITWAQLAEGLLMLLALLLTLCLLWRRLWKHLPLFS